jgi:hypothetical protein
MDSIYISSGLFGEILHRGELGFHLGFLCCVEELMEAMESSRLSCYLIGFPLRCLTFMSSDSCKHLVSLTSES